MMKRTEFESTSRFSFKESPRIELLEKTNNQKSKWAWASYLSWLLALFVLSSLITQLFIEPIQSKKASREMANEYANFTSPSPSSISESQIVADKDGAEQTAILDKFESLLQENQDIKGWLKIPGTENIDYPVLQTGDNQYYLERGFNQEKNQNGSLFFDAANQVSAEGTSQTLVIYGHNMKNGQMFHELKKYRDVAFYQQHPTLQLDTLYQENQYKIFACSLISEQEESFFVLRDQIGDSQQFLEAVADLRGQSYFEMELDVQASDELLLLSTCTYDLEGTRLLVLARKTRAGESGVVETNQAAQLIPATEHPDLENLQEKPAGQNQKEVKREQKNTVKASIPKTGDESLPKAEFLVLALLGGVLLVVQRKERAQSSGGPLT